MKALASIAAALFVLAHNPPVELLALLLTAAAMAAVVVWKPE